LFNGTSGKVLKESSIDVDNVALLSTTGAGQSWLGNNTFGAGTTSFQDVVNFQLPISAGNAKVGGSGTDTALGQEALNTAFFNRDNTAVGYHALRVANSSSSRNTAVGGFSLDAVTSAENNAALGYDAGGSVTTGGFNVCLGAGAGSGLTTGSNNILIGSSASPTSITVSHEITLGNAFNTALRCAVTTITSLSDRRDKKNIRQLNAGLGFINALQPVRFEWNTRDGQKVGVEEIGFVAQDLQEAQVVTGVSVPRLVYDVNPDSLEASYGVLVPVLVRAVQELTEQVNELRARLEGSDG
jgi:hypothetical protein